MLKSIEPEPESVRDTQRTMSVVSTSSENVNTATSFSSSMFDNQTRDDSRIPEIIHSVGFFVAAVGVVFGCFVINIVRTLDDDELRSRFSLLCVLICDVILAFSNLTKVIFMFALLDRVTFKHLQCPFAYVNLILSTIFSISLTLSLLCLAFDQVIAVFKPLYFRTSEGAKRTFIYGVIIFLSVPLTSVILIFVTFDFIATSDNGVDCPIMMEAASLFAQYAVVFIVPVAFSTPVIYAVVLWKISRQRCVHSENPLEHIQNRRLVVSFLLLSASYFLLWMPTLTYFSICYYTGDGCWGNVEIDVTLVVHTLFLLNYIIDPITCAVRMEPIKQRILQMIRPR